MNEAITIVCWLWKGWRPVYDHRHVNRLKRMLEQHMTGPYTLVCITDDPTGIECETFPLWELPAVQGVKPTSPNCYVRMRLFSGEMDYFFGPRILSLDLDCEILQDLRPLLTNDSFKCARGHQSYLNGSMWQLTLGAHREVWNDFDPIETPKLVARTEWAPGRPISGSDQAWMSIKLPGAPRWTEEDGVYQFMELRPSRVISATARVVFYAGRVKPWMPNGSLMNLTWTNGRSVCRTFSTPL